MSHFFSVLDSWTPSEMRQASCVWRYRDDLISWIHEPHGDGSPLGGLKRWNQTVAEALGSGRISRVYFKRCGEAASSTVSLMHLKAVGNCWTLHGFLSDAR